MNLKKQQKSLEEFQNSMFLTILAKGNDYANSDRLSNFKLAGQIAGITAEQQCLSLIATKVARVSNLINSDRKPENEAITDSLLDLANYAFLLNCVLIEKEYEH